MGACLRCAQQQPRVLVRCQQLQGTLHERDGLPCACRQRGHQPCSGPEPPQHGENTTVSGQEGAPTWGPMKSVGHCARRPAEDGSDRGALLIVEPLRAELRHPCRHLADCIHRGLQLPPTLQVLVQRRRLQTVGQLAAARDAGWRQPAPLALLYQCGSHRHGQLHSSKGGLVEAAGRGLTGAGEERAGRCAGGWAGGQGREERHMDQVAGDLSGGRMQADEQAAASSLAYSAIPFTEFYLNRTWQPPSNREASAGRVSDRAT